ncbi:MAG TPA: hypothetical protein PLA50_02715 [Bacteroidia bacterium]|nr:hypothetical protein [Bacteroidia bacterium]
MALEDYGIVSISTALVTKFTKRKKVEPGTPVLTSIGAFVQNIAKKLMWEISAEGVGDLPADFTVAGDGPSVSGISGGVTIVEEAEESQTSDGEPSKWSAKAVTAPSAT